MTKSPAKLRSTKRVGAKPPEDVSWLHDAVAIAPVGVFRSDPSGAFIYVNDCWCEMTGRRPAEVIGSSSGEHIHPEDRAIVRAEWENKGRLGLPYSCEYRYLRPDGTVRWMLGRVNAACDADGRILGYVGTSTDITELRLAREEIERARNDLEARVRERTRQLHEVAMVFEQSNDAIISSDLAGNMISWNRAAERLYGYTAKEAIGRSVLILVPPAGQAAADAMIGRLRAGESITGFESVRVGKDGRSIEVALSLFPLRDETGAVFGTCAIVRDIAEKKKIERRLQLLTRRLHHAHEEERRRIARELHDSTAQVLAALTMNLAALDQNIDPATHRHLLDDSMALAQQAVRELRTQSYLLHPPLLDVHGLAATLRCFAEGFTARSGIAVELELPADFPRLSEECEAALFRVAQESLANVHRHAHSPRAQIALCAGSRAIELTVRDFGCGLADDAGKTTGVGVAGMKERLEQLGGTLLLTSATPGTRVVATLPRD